jgi:TRAP-type uncharacterized transport system substrate-binding protein
MKTVIAILFSALSFNAYASKAVTSGDDAPARNANVLKIATGPKDKGYNMIFRNLQEVCGDKVPMAEVRSTGGLDNLSIMTAKKADMGTAQLDTIKDMAPGDENIQALKAVAPLNYNYLHVLTAAAGYQYDQGREWYGVKKAPQIVRVTKFSELKGRNVALVGSAQLMAYALQKNYLKDYGMRFINAASDAEAAKLVLSGQAQAMMTVSAAPYSWVSSLTPASNLTMIPFDEDIGGVYVVRKLNYKNINIYNLKALAVPNVLLARDFGGRKADQVQALYQCMVANLQELKDGEYEPAWNEMRLDAPVDLPRFRK